MNKFEKEVIEEIVEDCWHYTKKGKVVDYIPALSKVEPSLLGIAIFDGQEMVTAGTVKNKFTLQSISKVLTLALAIMDLGKEYVFSKVGMEPTGDPFNSIAKLENKTVAKPLNPMINAGALTVTSMLKGKDNEEKLERLLLLIRLLSNNEAIEVNDEVAKSEFETADLNRALCYFLRQHGVIKGDIDELLDLYTKQCAIEVDCCDLAKIGYVLGNKGFDPKTKKSIIPYEVTRIVKTFMVTCGMYNASGEFAIRVGVPAKSGVSGGIMCAIPYQLGIGVYSPGLDEKGNSLAGLKLLEMLSQRYDLSIF